MKKKKLILNSFIITLSISLVGTLYFGDFNKDIARKNYQKFIHSKYEQYENFKPIIKKDNPDQDRPDLALFQNYVMTVDPALKRVPSERLLQAYKYTQELTSSLNKSTNSTSVTWENINSNMGGRTRALMFDPNDVSGNKVWAGAVTGGLWYNDDITSNTSVWIPVDDFWTNLSISSIAYDPNNTDVFYVGTGEAQTALTMYRESSSRGFGIMKTEDGGETWTHLASTENFAFVNDIKVRNEDGTSVVYAAVVSGLYKGQEYESQPSDGLYRSNDNGVSWNQVLPNIPGETVPYAPSDIEFTADGRIFVGTMRNLDDKGGATILFSDTGTADSWTEDDQFRLDILDNTPGNNVPGRVMLAAAPSDANIIYATISVGTRGAGFDGFDKYEAIFFLKSIDKGATWTQTNLPDGGQRNWAYLAWHALTLAVDPNDPNIVFAGGLDLHRTMDGGTNWQIVSDWAAMYYGGGDDYVHADQHIILYKQGSSREVIFGCDGGVFYTSTPTQNQPIFKERNMGFSTLQFYSCDINSNVNATQFIGGLQDNGTIYYISESIENIDMVSGGDGAFCFFDDDEESLFITSVYNNVYYIFYNDEFYNYSNDFQCGLFVNPADYNSETNTLYANAATSYETRKDQIVVMDGFPHNITGQYHTLGTGAQLPFSAVKLSPDGSRLYLGTQDGQIFKVDVTETPFVITDITSSDFPTSNISSISIGNANNILITFSNYGVTSVWQSTNGGDSWINKEGNLPDMPIRWSLYHPQNANQVMLATELGIWETMNINAAEGAVWVPSNEGLANVRTDMIQIREEDNKVIVASHGRGLYTGIYNVDPTISTQEIVSNNNVKIYPNPGNGIINIDGIDNNNLVINVFDISGKLVANKSNTNSIDISSLTDGIYFVQLAPNNIKFKYIKE